MKKLLTIISFAVFLAGFSFASPAFGTVLFEWSANNGECGKDLPHPPFRPWDFRKNATPQTVCDSDGSKYFQWKIADNQHDAYVQIYPGNFPINAVAGRTYYLGFKVNFTRLNGKDVWCNTPNLRAGECFDKFIELRGGSRLRWLIHFGEKGMMTPHGKFSTFLGSFSHGVNKDVEEWGVYYQNHNGYSRYNSKLLEYERWYNVVMAVKMASDRSGSIALYIDGEKIMEYRNIKTMESNARIEHIGMNGTLGQPSYKINAHLRKTANLLLTDNWQEIVARGYLKSPTSGPTSPAPPAPPINLKVTGN